MAIKVGVIGGGQLAAMMAIAAKSMGIDLVVMAETMHDPAALVADEVILGTVDEAIALTKLAQSVDAITFENEFVDLKKLQSLTQFTQFIPSLETLQPLLDKFRQRSYLQALQIPVPQFYPISNLEDLSNQPLQYPLVLKARRNGYDGQGTKIVNSQTEAIAAWQQMGQMPALVETKIEFILELAVMVARSATGECVTYPVVETHQLNQVCHNVIAPARIDADIAIQVQDIAKVIAHNLKAVGILGIEYFLTADGKVSVNEIAPRTHNSGHYTIEACATSQFEQLLRIVTNLPLGDVALRSPVAVMVNLLGYEQNDSPDYSHKLEQLKKLPNCTVHWYGKTKTKIGRKLGHVTILTSDDADIESMIALVNSIWQ